MYKSIEVLESTNRVLVIAELLNGHKIEIGKPNSLRGAIMIMKREAKKHGLNIVDNVRAEALETIVSEEEAPAYTVECDIVEKALKIVSERFKRLATFTSPFAVKNYLTLKYGRLNNEVFSVMFLDNQNRLIIHEELFSGTINAASVYIRVIIERIIKHNAANVIVVHNHPSGLTKPSDSDLAITRKLKNALQLIDVSILDHFIVGEDIYSMAENGDL